MADTVVDLLAEAAGRVDRRPALLIRPAFPDVVRPIGVQARTASS